MRKNTHYRGSTTLVAGLVASLSLMAPEPVTGQGRPVVAEPVSSHRYEGVASVLETDSGLLVSETQAATVWLVTPDGSRRAWSRGSLRRPGALLTIGDTVLVYERAVQGFLRLNRDGSTAPPPDRFRTDSSPGRIELAADRYAGHSSGRMAWSDRARGAPVAVLRHRIAGAPAWDSVATLRVPPTRTIREGAIGMTISIPFSPVDAWAFLPDGGIAIVRAEPYRVDRLGPDGRLVEGRPHAIARSPITEADRAAFRARSARELQQVNIAGLQMPTVPDTEWPTQLPPFIGQAAVVAPDGGVWVQRARSVSEPGTHYDVFAAGGAWRETVLLPAASRIAGFGTSHAYLVVAENDGETLQRFPWR